MVHATKVKLKGKEQVHRLIMCNVCQDATFHNPEVETIECEPTDQRVGMCTYCGVYVGDIGIMSKPSRC